MKKVNRIVVVTLVISLMFGVIQQNNVAKTWAATKVEKLGIVQYMNHFYMRMEENVYWETAKNACEKLGGHLVQIENPQEQEFITELIQGAGDFYWLGGYYDGDDWRWVDGRKIQYYNWMSGQPDNEYSEEWMLEISSKNQSVNGWEVTKGGWNDVVGNATRGYICEWDSYNDIKITTTTDAVFSQNDIDTKINSLSDCANFVKTGAIIPGLVRTNQSDDSALDCCEQMVPQGVCYAGSYLLISAYCHNKKHSSVVYVLDKNTYTYKTTIRLKEITAHVGAMTYDKESVVYISGEKQLLKLSLQQIEEAVAGGQDVYNISMKKENAIIDIIDTPSFLCFRGKGATGKIYVGTFGESTFLNNSMQAYTTKGEKISGDKVVLPPQAQGAAICSYGGRDYIISSCSYGRNNKSKIYVQLLERAQGADGLYKMMSSYRKAAIFTYPNMTEDLDLQGGKLYINLESASAAYNTGKEGTMPIDRILYNSVGSLIERANKRMFATFAIRDFENEEADSLAEVLAEGECGEETTFTLYNNGKLVIEGIGNMADYEKDSAPWYEFASKIQEVTVGGEVTSIGTHAFDNCVNLKTVYLSSSIPDLNQAFTIKANSFTECTSLEEINLPDRIYEIEKDAFPEKDTLTLKSDAETVKAYCEMQENQKLSLHTHNYVKTETVEKTCTTFGYDIYECDCGEKTYKNITEDTGEHQFVSKDRVEATENENGQEVFECSNCGTEYVKELTYHPNAQVSSSPSPSPTATQQPMPSASSAPVQPENDRITASKEENKESNYQSSGSTKQANKIQFTKAKRPAKVKGIKVKKLRGNKKSVRVKVSWKKNVKAISSEIQYASKKSFANKKKRYLLGNRNFLSLTLKSKKTYYIRIRCWENKYSKWSQTVKVKVK